jgi:hypothetical protein
MGSLGLSAMLWRQVGKLKAELHQRNAQTRESERAGSQIEQQGQDRRNP